MNRAGGKEGRQTGSGEKAENSCGVTEEGRGSGKVTALDGKEEGRQEES